MRLENWFYKNGCLVGEVYNSPVDSDGTSIITSRVTYEDKDVVVTEAGHTYILGEPLSHNSLETLISKVEQWAEDRGIFENSTGKDQALKTMSEVGEFADNVLKGRDCRDDIGDILVTLILQCKIQKTSFQECLQLAYDEISSRKGQMVNGVFVKEGDEA